MPLGLAIVVAAIAIPTVVSYLLMRRVGSRPQAVAFGLLIGLAIVLLVASLMFPPLWARPRVVPAPTANVGPTTTGEMQEEDAALGA
jgi:hypothetical protein